MFSLFRFGVLIVLAAGLGANAQNPESVSASTSPVPTYALFQNATLTETGNTLTATWVPVVTNTGTTYENINILFDVDSKGNLTIAPGCPQLAPAPSIVVSAFKAGTYVGPTTVYGGGMYITVAGPGVISGGTTAWSLASTAQASSYTFPSTGVWHTGPVASNPVAARLAVVGITSTAWSDGLASSGCYSGQCNCAWIANALMGVSQVGNTITFVSFTDSNGKDHPTPLDTIVYTLVP